MSGALRGPKREAYWRRMVGGQAGSGLSARAWCGRRGLNQGTFYWWRRELARRDAERAKPAFVGVRVAEDEATSEAGCIEIMLAGQRRIRVSGRVNRQNLAEVLAVMTSASSVGPEGRAC